MPDAGAACVTIPRAWEPGDGAAGFEAQELRMATRNRGTPLEALRYDITPSGLHYLLIHFDIPETSEQGWEVEIGGAVSTPLTLSIAEIRQFPSVTMPVALECAGNARALLEPRPVSQPWLLEACSTAEWTGTPLCNVLERAGLKPEAREIVFTGADRGVQNEVEHEYARSLTVSEAMGEEKLLAYEMNGRPLEPQHGAPLRLIVPRWYGMASVKWLRRLDVITGAFEGFQQAEAYRYQNTPEEAGDPVTRMRVRALMIPPGIPDCLTRRRLVSGGRQRLYGRAWSGDGPVVRVEVGVDGSWSNATLEEPIGAFAWRGWWFDWDAVPGVHELRCRATDAAGDTQPLEQRWNVQGMGNNVAQRVTVYVD
jgi:sulfane dehydrogenase subunit SoxC